MWGLLGRFLVVRAKDKAFPKSYLSLASRWKQKGFEKLFAYVRGDNERALGAYFKQGFKVVGTAKKHAKVSGVYVDEVLIEKFQEASKNQQLT